MVLGFRSKPANCPSNFFVQVLKGYSRTNCWHETAETEQHLHQETAETEQHLHHETTGTEPTF